MTIITATEFKKNMGQYLEQVGNGDIVITRNGKRVAKLTDASKDKSDILQAITGILPVNASLEAAREERMNRHESRD